MDVPNFLNEQPKEALPDITLTTAEVEKLERTIKNMSNDEKKVAVRKIPTFILQNEITRRIKRDEEYKREFMSLAAKYQEEY